MKKRFFAGILALCMLLTMLPMAAFAAEEEKPAEPEKAVAIAAYLNGGNVENPAGSNAATYGLGDITTNEETNTVTVPVVATDLKAHKTSDEENGIWGYWAGIGIQIAAGSTVDVGWCTMTDGKPVVPNKEEQTAQKSSFKNDDTIVVGDTTYYTYYWNVGPNNKGNQPKEGEEKNQYGYITVTAAATQEQQSAEKGSEPVKTTYIVDFSKVELHEYNPIISDVGYMADGDKADTAITALRKKIGNNTECKDSARDTMWFKVEGLDPTQEYTAWTVSDEPEAEAAEAASKPLPDRTYINKDKKGTEKNVYYLTINPWKNSQGNGQGETILNGDTRYEGTYSIKLYKGAKETLPSNDDDLVTSNSELELEKITLDVDGGTGMTIEEKKNGGNNQHFYDALEGGNVTFYAQKGAVNGDTLTQHINVTKMPTKDNVLATSWKFDSATKTFTANYAAANAPTLDISIARDSDVTEASRVALFPTSDPADNDEPKSLADLVNSAVITGSNPKFEASGALMKVAKWSWFYGAGNIEKSAGYYLPLKITKNEPADAYKVERVELVSHELDGTQNNKTVTWDEVDGCGICIVKVKETDTGFDSTVQLILHYTDTVAEEGSQNKTVTYEVSTAGLGKDVVPTPTPAPPVIPPIVSTPTPAPTSEPSAEPTSEPTSNPTTEPTSQPSDKPTSTPTPTPGAVEIKPEVTVDENGAASAEVAGDQANQLVEDAKSDDVTNVTVKVEAPEDSAPITEATVALPGQAVEQLGSEANVDMTIDTPVGNVTLPGSSLSSLGKDAEKVTVTVAQKDDSTVAIEVKKDGQLVEKDLELKAELPASNNVSNTTVAVIVDKNGKETIVPKSVAENGKVTVLLKDGSATLKIKDNKKTFQDKIPSWAQDKVDFMASRELMVGNEKGLFAPDTKMNRAMLVQVLFSLESKPDTGVTDMFGDVKPGKWYTAAVSWGAQSGVIAGKPNGDFAPNENVTRETIAVILYAYAKHCGMDTTVNGSISGFGDASKVSGWAKNAMNWAIGAGVISGDGKNLNPKGEANRAEVATMITGFIKTMTK